MNRQNRPLCALVVLQLAVLFLAIGCNKGRDAPPLPTGGLGAAPAQASAAGGAGPSLFQANGCGRCHAFGGKPGGKAPDLTHAGAESSHTADWIARHIEDPKAQNPNSRMPAYKGKLSDADIKNLAAYLAAQK